DETAWPILHHATHQSQRQPGKPRIGAGEAYKAQVDRIDGGRQARFVKWACSADDAHVGESLGDLQRTDGGIRAATGVPNNSKAAAGAVVRERDHICRPIADPAATRESAGAAPGPIRTDSADAELPARRVTTE